MKPLLIAALLLLPLVAADHAYSHRYVIDGRLTGSDGLPLPGREVHVEAQTEDLIAPCREGMRPITDEFGDYRFCYHVHAFTSQVPRFNVTYGNVTVERAVDVALRRTSLALHEPNETGVAPEGWNSTYRVGGRAWRAGPVILEGVQVFGEAVIDLTVNLTVRSAEGTEAIFQTVTDGYGDFELVVETSADPSELSLTLEALGRGQPTQLDRLSHRTYTAIYLAPQQDSVLGGSLMVPASELREGAPGSTTPRLAPGLVVAVAVGLVLTIALTKRKVG